MKAENRWTPLEYKRILGLRRLGRTYRECGQMYDISAEQARRIILKAEHIESECLTLSHTA